MKSPFLATSLPRGLCPLLAWLGDSPSPLWVVDVSRQRMGIWENGTLAGEVPVSTSAHGLGNRPGSRTTPLGLHKVTDVIGRAAPAGQCFVSRLPVGDPVSDWRGGAEDMILSRVLPLRGEVPGLNGNSFGRHIYLHGTNREDLLGQPASHGCVRLANHDIIALADALGDDLPWVWIGEVKGGRSVLMGRGR